MKRKKLWMMMKSIDTVTYDFRMGYSFDIGILGAYFEDGNWNLHHIPTGLALGRAFSLLRDARIHARRIIKINAFDWYSTDDNDFNILGAKGRIWMNEVGNGEITPQQFDVNLMLQKMKSTDKGLVV